MRWRSPLEATAPCEPSPERSLKAVIVQTLTYFQKYKGLAKLFFMQIGCGDEQATEQLSEARANYRRILSSVIEDGIQQQHFLAMQPIEIETLISSIVGTVNWTIYEQLVVKQCDVDLQAMADRLFVLFWRGIQLDGTKFPS